MANHSSKAGLPFLRWAGSKRQLLPILSPCWMHTYKRYVEPFAGSACLFFHLHPNKALLGDINNELMATYREVKCRLPKVLKLLQKMQNSKVDYYMLRNAEISGWSSEKRAARFIYLNRFSFNGLYRTNKRGVFNVPYGGQKSGSLPSKEALALCSKALKKAKLVTGGFEKVLEMVEPGDFVYMDPPYSVSSRRVFKEYNGSAFDELDIKRLRKWMMVLRKKEIPFLVSYAESDEASFLAKDFYSRKVRVKRNIAGFAKNRSVTNEVLISSKPIPCDD